MCELNRAEYAVRLSDVMYRYLTAYLWALPAELHPPASIRFIAPSERLFASLESWSACGAHLPSAGPLCLHLRAFRQRVCAGDEEEDDESDDRKR